MTLPLLELVLTVGCGVTVSAILCIFISVFRKWRSEATRDSQRVFEQLDLLRAELMLMQEQISQLPRPQTVVSETRQLSEPRVATVVNAAAPRGYEVAARLARGGASADELMSSCGLSRHEASLLLRLHGAEHQQARGASSNATPAPTAKKAGVDATSKSGNLVAKKVDPVAPAARKSRLSVVG